MAITILSSSYTQTSTSVSVAIPFDRTTLAVSTSTNSAPTFNGVALTAGTSYNNNSTYYWWYYTDPPVGSYSLAAVSNTILNYFVLDNVDLSTPLSTQITVNSATFNANGTVYDLIGDSSTPFPTWFGVANLDYPGGGPLTATSVSGGSVLSNTYSIENAATLVVPSLNTSATTLNYNTNGSGIFASPAPSWIFLNNTDIDRFTSQVMIF